ncbi:MAG: hypothetical protein EOP53_01005 [Sphingobacteriales bacterium]|nr:MAG: hypothetical protein EOP53_01005 [Sphingobacteriales bacterium]
MYFKSVYLFFCLIAIFLSGCAIRNGGPVGGDQDVTPPKITKENPPNKTVHYDKTKIVISFDEYIELSNQQREITLTPALPENPNIYLTRKNVVIDTKNTKLQPNTTYVIQFGQAIRDINEGNVFAGYRYVFSTGDYIDSLYISGKVVNASTGSVADKVRINLYEDGVNDSAIYKLKPAYFTVTDASGNFKIENLRKGKYKIYGISDENQNNLVDPNELAGFDRNELNLDTSITLKDPIQIFPSSGNSFELRSAYIDNRKNALGFTQPVDLLTINNINVSGNNRSTLINEKRDSFIIYKDALNTRPQTEMKVVAKSGKLIIDTLVKIENPKTDTAKFIYKVADQIKAANYYGSLVALQFNYPVSKVDLNKLALIEEGKPVKIGSYSFPDSSRTIVALNYPFDEENAYSLKIGKDAFTSVFSQKSDSFTLKIQLPSRQVNGLLEVMIKLPLSDTSYIFQIVSNSGSVNYSKNIVLTQKVTIPYLAPGMYKMRLVKDVNKNDRWDTGNILEKKLPEEIIYYKDDLNIKANWELVDIVFDISKSK